MKLSILMPVYNERATLAEAAKRVTSVDYPCDVELVIVDDGSTDGTKDLYATLSEHAWVRVEQLPENRGKGAAVRRAAELAEGEYVIICDADCEYAPEEIPTLLEPILRGDAEVVYGTRTFGSHNAYSFWYVAGNRAVTLAANMLFNSYVSDVETCFKLMPAAMYRQARIRSAGFGMEAELTAKLLRQHVRVFEVPISYRARSREEGKKLTWRDGVEALWILIKVRMGMMDARRNSAVIH